MTVKEVVILCSELLDYEELTAYLNNQSSTDEERIKSDAKLLLKCFNLVTDEISREYFTLTEIETFTPVNGEISFEKFTFNPVLIKSVKGYDYSNVKYKINPVKIFTDAKVTVEYAYACPERNLDDKCDFTATKISKRILAYGVVYEYLLIKGAFEEAVAWRDKYQTGLRSVLSVNKSKKVKAREWV